MQQIRKNINKIGNVTFLKKKKIMQHSEKSRVENGTEGGIWQITNLTLLQWANNFLETTNNGNFPATIVHRVPNVVLFEFFFCCVCFLIKSSTCLTQLYRHNFLKLHIEIGVVSIILLDFVPFNAFHFVHICAIIAWIHIYVMKIKMKSHLKNRTSQIFVGA